MKPEMISWSRYAARLRQVPAELLRILQNCDHSKANLNVYENGVTIMLQFFSGEESVYLVQTIRGSDNHFAFHVFSKSDPCFGSINPKNIEVRRMELDWDTKWEEVPMTEDEVYNACVTCMTVDHSKCTDPSCTCCHGKGENA
jgi:hypothetical protein